MRLKAGRVSESATNTVPLDTLSMNGANTAPASFFFPFGAV